MEEVLGSWSHGEKEEVVGKAHGMKTYLSSTQTNRVGTHHSTMGGSTPPLYARTSDTELCVTLTSRFVYRLSS